MGWPSAIRGRAGLVSMLGVAACVADVDDGGRSPTCDADVHQRYAPFEAAEAELFPEPMLEVAAPSSPTGVRLSADRDVAPWLAGLPAQLASTEEGLDVATGFGRSGGVLLRFDGAVGTPEEIARRVRLLDLDRGVDRAFEVTLGEDPGQVVLQPLAPLAPGSAHGVVLLREAPDGEGPCVAPSSAMRALLRGDASDPRLARVAPRYAELLAVAGLTADDVGAATVFTTSDDRGVLRGVADAAASRAMGWTQPPSCDDGDERWRRCEGVARLADHRGADGLVRAEPEADWDVPVTLWLPRGPGPHPVVMYGHGLGGGRSEGRHAAEALVPLGAAVFAVDAMHHGAHPTSTGDSDPLAFLGLDIDGLVVDAIGMRASFDQTAADRLQVLELLRQAPDVDGDGAADLDMGRVGYLGVSLGGLLGPGVLANAPDIDAAGLVVGGAHLIRFVTDIELMQLAMPLLAFIAGGQDALQRALLVAQSAVDGSDPASHAAHVLRDRGDAAAPPHIVLPVATDDEIVPPSTGQYLARSLGLAHVEPVAVPVVELPTVPSPAAGNVDGVTAGYFQLDRVTDGGAVTRARHANTPLSPEGELVWGTFFEDWLGGDVPRVVDPYATLGTPPLDPG